MAWINVAAALRSQPPPDATPPKDAADWYRIVNTADDPDATDIYVYDVIGGWFGMYADEFIAALREVTTAKINLRINSPGGSVFEGIAIANAIRSHPARVTVYVDSLAASIASVIALAGDRLIMMPQSMMMIHDAAAAVRGNAADMEAMRDLLDKTSSNIADAYAARAGGTRDEWRDVMRAETWYLAGEAVEAGLADEAMPLPPREDEPEPQDRYPDGLTGRMTTLWDLTAYQYAGRDAAPAPVMPRAAVRQPIAGERITAEMTMRMSEESVRRIVTEVVTSAVSGLTVTGAAEPSTGGVVRTEKMVLVGEQGPETVLPAPCGDTTDVIEGAVSPAHSTAVKSGTWDVGAQEKRLSSPVPLATVKKMYTFWDEDQADDGKVPKTACKLPHHFVSEDGTPGAASINGVRNALARLPQTQGLSDDERSAAQAHLRKHLNAFDDAEDTDDTDDVEEDDNAEETDDLADHHPGDAPPGDTSNTDGGQPNTDDGPAADELLGRLRVPQTSPDADDDLLKSLLNEEA